MCTCVSVEVVNRLESVNSGMVDEVNKHTNHIEALIVCLGS